MEEMVVSELERRVEERTAELSDSERKYRKLSQQFQTLLNAISDTLILLSREFPVSRCRPIFSRWGRFRLGGLFLGRIAR